MKNFRFLKLFLVSSLCLSSFLHAGTLFVIPGAEATGIGGAFTAVADDSTAIYYNPAGLTNLEGNGFEASCFFMDAKAKTDSKIVFTDEEDWFYKNDYDKLKVKATIPFFAGYTKYKNIHLAIGIYGIGGGTGKWKGEGIDNYNWEQIWNIKNEYSFLVYNLSGAKKINEKIALGVGLNIIQMKEEQNIYAIENDYEYGSELYRRDITNYKKETDDIGYEGVLGAIYKPIEKLKLGFTFKTGCKIKLKGDLDSTWSYFNKYAEEIEYGGEKNSYKRDYKYPMTCSLGAGYDITEKMLLALSFDFAHFSKICDENDEKLGYKNTCVISLGTRYKLKENLDLLCGIRRDPSLYKKENVNLFNTDQYALTVLTLGAAYRYKSMKFAGSIVYNISDSLTDNYDNSYEFDSVVYRGTIGYNF